MNVRVSFIILSICAFWKTTLSNENSVYFTHKVDSRHREELVISNLTSSDHFNLGLDVQKWKSITVGMKNYAVGLMTTSVCIITPNKNATHNIITDASDKLIDVELFKTWDSSLKSYISILILLSENRTLLWYEMLKDLKLKKFWTYDFDNQPAHIKAHTIDNTDHLFVLNKVHNDSSTSLDIYKFNLTSTRYKHLWLEQIIDLVIETSSFTLNAQGLQYYLSIPQKSLNVVKIYKRDNNKFIPYFNIEGSNADIVESFNLGSNSYLLTNGDYGGIYKFTKYGPIRETILHNHDNSINYWLPLPVQTYRDEIFLLAQSELNHGGHTSLTLEIIHSSGFGFGVYDEIPCTYFKQQLNGIDCIVEEDHYHTAINQSAILPFENAIGLIVPRSEKHSLLFFLNIGSRKVLNPRETQIQQFRDLRSKLEDMHQNVKKEQVVMLSNTRKDSPPQTAHQNKNNKEYDQRLSSTNPMKDFENRLAIIRDRISGIKKLLTDFAPSSDQINVGILTINGPLQIGGNSNITIVETSNINNTNANDTLNDIVQVGQKKLIIGEKLFTNLTVDNIIFNEINGHKQQELIFKDTNPITVKGKVLFSNTTEVDGDVLTTSRKVNGINLEEEVVQSGKNYDDLISIDKINVADFRQPNNKQNGSIFDNKIFDSLIIPSNITVTNINLENFDMLLKKMVFRDVERDLPGEITVEGVVKVVEDINITLLNNLKFPEDYVLCKQFENITISGHKIFENEVSTKTMTINGYVNGLQTNNIRTLSDNNNISETVYFNDMKVLKENNSDNITGKHMKDFKPNLGLNETNNIQSKVIFTHLEVDGLLIIEENINNVDVRSYLNNFVFKDEKDVVINSTKQFKNNLLVRNINLEHINMHPIETFVKKTENQILNIKMLDGNVTFENLYTKEFFGGTNVTDLLENSVNLNQHQNISSSLTFLELFIRNMTIEEKLNSLPAKEYIYTTSDKMLPSVTKLKHVTIKHLIVEGDITGDIYKLNIEELKRKFSNSSDQHINADVHVQDLFIEKLNVTTINDRPFDKVFDYHQHEIMIHDMIMTNRIKIKNLSVLGNLTIISINNISMEDIQSSSTFTNRNSLQPIISFKDKVNFKHITVDNFNGKPFNKFIENLVFRNETNVKFAGTKVFINGFEVLYYLETESLNDIAIENILRKKSNQVIDGPLIIYGNVTINEDTEIETLNGILVKDLKDRVKISENNFQVNGDVWLNKLAYVDNLWVQGHVNGENLTELWSNVIQLNDDVFVSGKRNFTFKNKVIFEKDLDVAETLNDINVSELFDDIVMINRDAYIKGLVSFQNMVNIGKKLTLETDLSTDNIMGINLQDWVNNAVLINQQFIPEELKFENVTLEHGIITNFINKINMSRLIPLRTHQNIAETIHLKELSTYNEIEVRNKVNGLKLLPEYLNTVLNHGPQAITSKIVFDGLVMVYKEVVISALVNNRNFSRIVKTDQDQVLNGVLKFFSKIFTPNITVRGLVNGINISEWQENSLTKTSSDAQNISEPLEVKHSLILENHSQGGGLISGLNFSEVINEIEKKLPYEDKIKEELLRDYKEVCEDVRKVQRTANAQIYKFKYMDQLGYLDVDEDIKFLYNFKQSENNYLLIRSENSCQTDLFKWSYKQFLHEGQLETGEITQMISVNVSESARYFVGITDLSSSCEISGTHTWKFDENGYLSHVQILPTLLLLQESKVPKTFYGLDDDNVYEFKIGNNLQSFIYRKWPVIGDNLIFLPPELNTGLALKNDQKILKLKRESVALETEFDFDLEAPVIGNQTVEDNNILMYDMTVLKVGKPKKSVMIAVTKIDPDDVLVETRLDLIEVYSDIFQGKLFDKIPTYKPSSLVSLEFENNGETLLIFMEDKKVLQVYEYKGIEGFKHRKSVKIEGENIIKMKLPLQPNGLDQNVLAVVSKSSISLLEVVTDGTHNTNMENLQCTL